MHTEKQNEASRTNGALSHGPTTEEGKQKSAQNAIKAGFRAQQTVLEWEPRSEFRKLIYSLMNKYRPQSPSEEILVRQFASAEWKRRRAEAIETALFDLYADDQSPITNAPGVKIDHLIRIALAYKGAANDSAHALDRIQREYTRLSRLCIRLEQRLAEIKASRPPTEKPTCTNEPKLSSPLLDSCPFTSINGPKTSPSTPLPVAAEHQEV